MLAVANMPPGLYNSKLKKIITVHEKAHCSQHRLVNKEMLESLRLVSVLNLKLSYGAPTISTSTNGDAMPRPDFNRCLAARIYGERKPVQKCPILIENFKTVTVVVTSLGRDILSHCHEPVAENKIREAILTLVINLQKHTENF